MGLLDPRVEYKPFEFPFYYKEGWLKQAQVYWLPWQISMQGDVKDWNENLTEDEKFLVGNILLGFTQTETAVEDYWATHVYKWFPKWEIKIMASMFSAFESIHATAYSYLNETLGLTDFKGFLQEPSTKAKFDMLVNTLEKYDNHTLLSNATARKDAARSLAVFSGFVEGVSLFSSFAILYSFSLSPRNMLKGTAQQMKYSVRDEGAHSRMGCALFNHLCRDYPELRGEVEKDIFEAARLAVDLEWNFIDTMFQRGDLQNLKAYDLKHFILRRANEKLNELGYESIFDVDIHAANELSWFSQLTGGVMHTDFFAAHPTDYSRSGSDEGWDLIFPTVTK